MSDRTAHAEHLGVPSFQIVRYDRAGKWYVEWDIAQMPRRRVAVADAARMAAQLQLHGTGKVYFGRPGGASFDRRVRKELASAKRAG